jgi:hypothetical protein
MVTDSVDGMFIPRCSGTYRMFMRKEPDGVWRLSYIGVHLDSELAGPLGWVKETSAADAETLIDDRGGGSCRTWPPG